MKNFSSYFVSLALAATCFGCNSSQPDSTKDAKDTNAVKMDSSGTADHTTSTIPASVSKDDATFVVNTADAGMTEVQLGQLAQQKGKDKDVKMYGAMMEKDHTAAGDKLKALATSKNITLPASVSADMQKAIDNLQQKNGNDFDNAYISQMIDDHKKVISMFETESKNGSDTDIKAFVDSTLPKLRMHLEKAQECHKMMKKM
jgi:putative membrane protein